VCSTSGRRSTLIAAAVTGALILIALPGLAQETPKAAATKGKSTKAPGPAPDRAALLPDQFGPFTKGKTLTQVAAPDPDLYAELGFEQVEQAEYQSPEKKHFTATAWRFHDSTGAMAAYEAARPPEATPSKVAKLAVRTPTGLIFTHGNYLFQLSGSAPATLRPAAGGNYVFEGSVPSEQDLDAIYEGLPKLEQSPLPTLMSYLPSADLVPNSERYVIGPVSLQRFDPGITPSVAAFHLGSEAQLGNYKSGKGLFTMAVFNYPTPGIAKERADEFGKVSGAMVKRTGALVAVILNPVDPDAAERTLAQVRYNVNLTWNEKVPVNEIKGMATLLINIVLFAGLMVCVSIVGGIGFGGFRVIARKFRKSGDPESMVTLDLHR